MIPMKTKKAYKTEIKAHLTIFNRAKRNGNNKECRKQKGIVKKSKNI